MPDRTGTQGYPGEMPSMRLARAYIPLQVYGRTFSAEEGLERGTIFPELYEPYEPREREDWPWTSSVTNSASDS